MVALAIAPLLAACLAAEPVREASLPATLPSDAPLQLPTDPYYSADFDPAIGYHSYEALTAKIASIVALNPGIARLETIGESREGRSIRAIVIENREVPGPKPAAFYDGGHHANEVEGVEVIVAFAEVLVSNYATNASIRELVDRTEIWIVPLVNPDGYVVQTRHNAENVNLNRNYDIDWCDPAAYNTCGPPGDAIIAATGEPFEYAGETPFSEPESRAIRDATTALGDRLAFYVSHHTDVHCITSPWTAPQPPFPVPQEHQDVFDSVFEWVESNTEFGAGRWQWLTGECMSYSAGGTSMDWAYATHRVPSFTFEVSGDEGREGAGLGKPTSFLDAQVHGNLPHWVEATLPVELFFLANAEALRSWDPGLREPPEP